MRLFIAIPTHEMVPARFMYDFANLIGFSVGALGTDKIEYSMNMMSGTYVHSAREELARAAIESGADFVLWVDTDMSFPKDALLQLLARKKEMVGINYSSRGMPPHFVAIKDIVGNTESSQARRLITGDDDTGVEEALAVGFGMVLMRTSVLRTAERIASESKVQRLFWFDWDQVNQQQMGEDVWFCQLVRETGTKIYVDHDLSKQCAHVGQFEYRTAHAYDSLLMQLEEAKSA
jgi:hypothetical protein